MAEVLTKDDIKMIKSTQFWEIASIDPQYNKETPIDPDFAVLCNWKSTAWNTKDPQMNAFMEAHV